MRLPVYLGLLHRAERTLAGSFRQVASGHGEEPDVHQLCLLLADWCEAHEQALAPVVQRYGEVDEDDEPERLHAEGLSRTRTGPVGLLRDLQDLYVLASLVDVTWTVVGQAGAALRDHELVDVVARCEGETSTQLAWLTTRIKQAAPQALVAAD